MYWKPVFNILEGSFEVILVNAREVKNVPGRKTDMCDAEWLVDLLRHGLIRGSFIPPEPIRVLRDLTKYRKKASEGNRPGCQHQIGQRSNGHLRRIGQSHAG